MDQQQFCLRWNNHSSTLVAVFDNLLASQSLVDVTLFAEGHLLKAHKVVLSACSPYFQRLFSETDDRHPIVVLKDVSHHDLRALLEYMYRGEVNVAQDQLEPLIRTAESLRIKGLADGPRGTTQGNGSVLRPDSDTHGPSPLGGASLGSGTVGGGATGVPQSERCRVKSESGPGSESSAGRGLGEQRSVSAAPRLPSEPYSLPVSSVPSVLSTVLTMPPALTLAAAAAANPLVPKIKLDTPAVPQEFPVTPTSGSPLAKRRRKARHPSGDTGDHDSGGDSDGHSSNSPGDPLHQLPRIPATITPVGPLYGTLLRDEDRGGSGGGSSLGGGGSSSPSPDSLGGSTRGDSAPPPGSPLPRPFSAQEPPSSTPFKPLQTPRHDETSSDANHHSDDDQEVRESRSSATELTSDAGPSTSRLPPEDAPHTPGYLGWPYPQDPPSSSEDSPFPSLENTNQDYLRAFNFVRAGFHGLLPPRLPQDLLIRPPPINLPLLLKNRDYKYPVKPSTTPPHPSGYPYNESPKQFACDKCGRTYASTGNLKRHKKYECGVEPQFSCPICKKKFQHRHSVKIHVFSTHRNEAGEGGPPDTRDSPAIFPSSEGVGVGVGVGNNEFFPIPQEANAPSSQNQDS